MIKLYNVVFLSLLITAPAFGANNSGPDFTLSPEMEALIARATADAVVASKDEMARAAKILQEAYTNADKKMCPNCGKLFDTTSNLKTHMRKHTGEKPFTCEICKKNLGYHDSLMKHMRRHTGKTPFKCDICPKTFTQSSHLNTHMLSHTGAKPFTCEICKKTFGQKQHLKTHIRRHTGEKPFKCDLCNKCFSQNVNLKQHKSSMHPHATATTLTHDILPKDSSKHSIPEENVDEAE